MPQMEQTVALAVMHLHVVRVRSALLEHVSRPAPMVSPGKPTYQVRMDCLSLPVTRNWYSQVSSNCRESAPQAFLCPPQEVQLMPASLRSLSCLVAGA